MYVILYIYLYACVCTRNEGEADIDIGTNLQTNMCKVVKILSLILTLIFVQKRICSEQYRIDIEPSAGVDIQLQANMSRLVQILSPTLTLNYKQIHVQQYRYTEYNADIDIHLQTKMFIAVKPLNLILTRVVIYKQICDRSRSIQPDSDTDIHLQTNTPIVVQILNLILIFIYKEICAEQIMSIYTYAD